MAGSVRSAGKHFGGKSFAKHNGFISEGGDLFQGNMTLHEAKLKAISLLPDCAGFCFKGHEPVGDATVQVIFKSKWDIAVKPVRWTSYKVINSEEERETDKASRPKIAAWVDPAGPGRGPNNWCHEVGQERDAFMADYLRYSGHISKGGDILVGIMTLKEAKKKALTLPGCQGFCFRGGEIENPNEKVQFTFKNKWDNHVGANLWTSFRVLRLRNGGPPVVSKSTGPVNGAGAGPGRRVVSDVRDSNGVAGLHEKEQVVDVFDEGIGLQENVPMALLHLDRTPNKILPSLKRDVPGKDTWETFQNAGRILARRPMLGLFEPDAPEEEPKVRWLTWAQTMTKIDRLARMLSDQLPAQAYVGIFGRNSVDWILAFTAVTFARMTSVCVPIFSKLDFARLVLSETEAAAVFVEAPAELGSVRQLLFSDIPLFEQLGATLPHVPAPEASVPEEGSDDKPLPLYIAFGGTSTGRPKGVAMAEASFNEEICERLGQTGEDDYSAVHLFYWPLTQAVSPINLFAALCAGGRAAPYPDADNNAIIDSCRVVGPTWMTAAPNFWGTLYRRFQAELEKGESERDLTKEVQRTWLGPRIQLMSVTGAVPIPKVMAWLQWTFPKAGVTEIYSTAETGKVTSGNAGAPQPILPGVSVRLEDFGAYSVRDDPPRGQVCVKTRMSISGYFKGGQELSQHAFTTDGYFRTGDIGEMPDSRHLRIIDRIEHAFQLFNGEWVSPQSVEVEVLGCKEIRQAFVHGSESHNFVVAVFVSDADHMTVQERIEGLRARLKSQTVPSLRSFEVPLKFHLVTEPWTEANGCEGWLGELDRPALRDLFQDVLTRLIDEGAADVAAALVAKEARRSPAKGEFGYPAEAARLQNGYPAEA